MISLVRQGLAHAHLRVLKDVDDHDSSLPEILETSLEENEEV